jgi:hypothetical protein
VTAAEFPATPARALGCFPASRFSGVQSGAERAVADENKPQQMVAKNARIQARCTGECTHAGRGSVNAQGGLPHEFTVISDAKQFRSPLLYSGWVCPTSSRRHASYPSRQKVELLHHDLALHVVAGSRAPKERGRFDPRSELAAYAERRV